jgi:hypothetical protein
MNAAQILRRLAQGETDYFEFLIKIRNENSRNIEYETRWYPSRLSKEYLCAI